MTSAEDIEELDARSPSVRELATGLTILSELLDSGLPLSRSLETFTDLAPPSWAPFVPVVRRAVREGASLSTALHTAGLPLSSVVSGILAAGEFGGGLPSAVRRAAEQSEQEAATRDALVSAVTYPALVAVAGLAAMALIVGQVLPRFELLLADVGRDLPLSTRVTLAVGRFARESAVWALAVVGVLVVAVRQALRSPTTARALDRVLLRLPVVGALRQALGTARVTNALAALLESGVPLRAGLSHASQAVGDRELAARLDAAREAIASGSGIAATMSRLEALTPTAARLIAAGEETGQLAHMLRHAARLEQARAGRLVTTGVRLLEPALIVLIAVAVGFVALAMLQAVYAVQPT